MEEVIKDSSGANARPKPVQRWKQLATSLKMDTESGGSRRGTMYDADEEEKAFLKKSAAVLSRKLHRPRRSLAAFSEISLSRSSFRLEQEDERVRVEYYVNENTLKQRLHFYYFKNQRSSLRIRIARFTLKLLTCVLYIIRVILDKDPTNASCYECTPSNKTAYLIALDKTEEEFLEDPVINWDAMIWVERPVELWVVHVILGLISFIETLLLVYLNYKGNVFQQLMTRRFLLELFATVPFIVTLFHPTLRNLFVPVFLNCWLAKYALENMFNDLHRAMQRSQSALSHQLTILMATLLCLVFTSVCGFQHCQRAGHRRINLFQSTYLVVVTFSTVGYGDFVPDIWPSQFFMIAMICIALIVLPTQCEQLAFTWMERQKLGGSYSSHRAHNERHVVVCSTTLVADTIMDFLNEFYAHPLLQDFFVVLLSPMELDPTMRMILQVPMWAQRVIYIQGSCLKDADLTRARMGEAEACFILAARNYQRTAEDKTAADEHTILRSWAVKDFAPAVPQYVQILRPENKLHVRFAEHVVCEDEFKYALLSNNCLFPGVSTLVTLLLHTSRGQEGQTSKEEWHRLYGKCSGNEIYHIRLGDSRIFGEYEGKSFIYASFHAHRKYGVALVGVRPAQLPEFYEDTILLNPGPRHIMRKSDLCFYLSITKEENSSFSTGNNNVAALGPNQNQDSPDSNKQQKQKKRCDSDDNNDEPTSPLDDDQNRKNSEPVVVSTYTNMEDIPMHTIQINVDHITDEERRKSITPCPSPVAHGAKFSLLSLPKNVEQKSNSRRPSILPVPDRLPENYETPKDGSSSEIDLEPALEGEADGGATSEEGEDDVPWIGPQTEKYPQLTKGFPPVSPYIGVTPTLCYLLREKKPLCCLQLAQACEHCPNRTAYDYKWKNKTIILAADYASTAIYNFIVPLRAHFRPKSKLNPIILLLERRPDASFLDAAAYFPMIYWYAGSIDSLDDLLRSGITLAESVVVVNKELSNSAEEESLSDCNTICAVQTMFRFFPNIKIVTELSTSSNMRFMQFRAHDTYALYLSRMEKREKERGSHISYMFRLPFAAGSVFSASMLDTLLYQAFVKEYLITFVRLLLGIDQAPGSGFLTSTQITKDDLWVRTYGRLYQKLCSTSCEIPIGIYRTQESQSEAGEDYFDKGGNESPFSPDSPFHGHKSKRLHRSGDNSSNSSVKLTPYQRCFQGACGTSESSITSAALTVNDEFDSHTQLIERAEIASLVRSRMESLGLPCDESDLQQFSERRNSLSYVIINPSCDLKLKEGDIVYLIRPSPFSATKTFERHNSRRKSTLNNSSGAKRNENVEEKEVLDDTDADTFPEKDKDDPSPTRRRSSSDSPRLRTNSLKICPSDDILLRRSNSLRQGMGLRPSRAPTEEIGLPKIAKSASTTTTVQQPGFSMSVNVEVTPPSDMELQHSVKSTSLQGTIV